MNLNELYQIKRYLDEISSLCERNVTDIQHINSLIGMSLKNDLDEDLKRLLNVIRMYNSKIRMNDGIISDANCVSISEYVNEVIDSYSSMIFSSGRYYIGDLCYVEFNHNQFYDHETEYGAGAQSLSKSHLSYNIGKNNRSVEDWISNPTKFDDFYKLSKPELVAKHIAISMYFGRFNRRSIEDRFNIEFFKIFDREILFLLSNEYLYRDGDEYIVTRKGFEYYYGIVGLFYSIPHQEYVTQMTR